VPLFFSFVLSLDLRFVRFVFCVDVARVMWICRFGQVLPTFISASVLSLDLRFVRFVYCVDVARVMWIYRFGQVLPIFISVCVPSLRSAHALCYLIRAPGTWFARGYLLLLGFLIEAARVLRCSVISSARTSRSVTDSRFSPVVRCLPPGFGPLARLSCRCSRDARSLLRSPDC
jgi:hypothetical protein